MLKLNNIKKIYKGNQSDSIVALQNVNIEFPNSGLVFITGHSGSGKSSLLNIIAGLDTPTEGTIENGYGEFFYSMIFQDFQLVNYLTIKENLMLSAEMFGSVDEVNELSSKYDISDILEHYPNEISGGQKQRAAIVRSLLMHKPVILCDEPTGNLDEDNSILIANTLKEESRTRLVVVVSHDKEIFDSVADRIITIRKGKIESDVIVSEGTNEIVCDNTMPNFGFVDRIKLCMKYSLKNKFKHAMLFVSLLLSMMLLITSFNMSMIKTSDVKYNVYSNDNYVSIDLEKKSDVSKYSERALTIEEREYYTSKYKAELYFDKELPVLGAVANRIYVSDKVHRKLIYGKSDLEYGEIAISDYLAHLLNGDNYEDLIGQESDGAKIVAIYKTKYSTSKYDKKYLDAVYNTAYMNEKTYKHMAYSTRSNTRIMLDTGEANATPIDIYNSSNALASRPSIYGTSEINDGEIVISSHYAKRFASDISSLIGNKVSVLIKNCYDQHYLDYSYVSYNYEFIVKGIVDDVNWNSMMLSDSDYIDMSELHAIGDNYYCKMGISLFKYSKGDVRKLLNDGFEDQTAISYDIWNGLDWIDGISNLTLTVGIVMLVVSCLILITFIHGIFTNEKRTQGVLASFGIKKAKIISMYFMDILFAVVSPLLIVILFEPAIVYAINSYMISQKITVVSCMYYVILSPLTVIMIYAMILIIVYSFLLIKIKNKNIIDIIYER